MSSRDSSLVRGARILQQARRKPDASTGYLLAGALQGALGFVSVAVISRTLGMEGLAVWGIDLLEFQVGALLFSLGLPPLVAAHSVRMNVADGDEQRTFGVASSLTILSSLVAIFLVAVMEVAHVTSGLLLIILASGATAFVQVLTARLRGAERHWTNAAVLCSIWTLGYGGAVFGIIVTETVSGYWAGLAAGTSAALSVSWLLSNPGRLLRPTRHDLGLLRSGLGGLPHLVANLLLVGSLRPLAGWTGGSVGTASLTVASQYSQAAGMLHQAYWSTRMPTAIRQVSRSSSTELKRLRNKTVGTMAAIWLVHASFAPLFLRLVVGSEVPRVMLLASILLGGVPLFSVLYDLYAGTLWRQSRSLTLSAVSVGGLLLLLITSPLLASIWGVVALPAALLGARLLQGIYVSRAVKGRMNA